MRVRPVGPSLVFTIQMACFCVMTVSYIFSRHVLDKNHRLILLQRPAAASHSACLADAIVTLGCNKSHFPKSLRDSDRNVNSKLETIYVVKFSSEFYIFFELGIVKFLNKY